MAAQLRDHPARYSVEHHILHFVELFSRPCRLRRLLLCPSHVPPHDGTVPPRQPSSSCGRTPNPESSSLGAVDAGMLRPVPARRTTEYSPEFSPSIGQTGVPQRKTLRGLRACAEAEYRNAVTPPPPRLAGSGSPLSLPAGAVPAARQAGRETGLHREAPAQAGGGSSQARTG